MTDVTKAGSGGCPVFPGYDPLDQAELADPFPSYARARDEAPVFFSEEHGFWSVTRRDDILAIIRDSEHLSNSARTPRMHFCVSAPLFKLELRVTLDALLDIAPDMALVPGQEFTYRDDIRLDSMRSLHIDLGAVPGSWKERAAA